jgi:hypothetical protein
MTAGAPPFDLRAAGVSFAARWQQFFHAPIDARLCAGLRMGYALAVLINLACWYPDLERWFTNTGVLPAADLIYLQAPERWSRLTWLSYEWWSEGLRHKWPLLGWLPLESQLVPAAAGLLLLHATLLLLGVGARFNALCVLVWLVSFQNRNPLLWDSEDTLLRLIGCYVLLMPCAQAWTIHRLWQRPAHLAPVLVPAWGLRLLQIQMAFIFLTAAWFKLNGEAWRSGTAMFYVAQLDDYYGRTPLPGWLFQVPWLGRLLTWSVMGVEATVPLGVWFKQTRLPCLALALVFHLGNELTMHLYLFHWLMLLGWSAFLLPQDFAWLSKKSEPQQI